ncbi:MAG: hypothetical protein IPI66_03715 [Chitinophagaceae bacterium]|nr:hypothetical protein [Chitinophagaceae bacterium]MBL0055460.1 hypothetical protein [Chitinophagaceae bacterium]
MFSAFNPAEAQVRLRSANQHSRIRQGVRNGELTRAETINLSRRERSIRREMRRAKADGVVTPGERRQINREQRRLNRSIARKKHNKRDRNF